MALYARPPAPSSWAVPAPYYTPYENNSANQSLRDREREFIKLPKIRLRSESSGKVVEPNIEGDHRSVSLKHHEAIDATNMNHSGEGTTATVQKPSLPSMSVLGHHKAQDDSRRDDLPLARTVPSQPLQPKPVMAEQDANLTPPVRQPSQLQAVAVPRESASHARPRSQPRFESTVAHAGLPQELLNRFEAVDRLQAQINFNRATLETCTRDIESLGAGFRQIQDELKSIVAAVRAELHAVRQHPTSQGRIDDPALELFSNTLSQVVSKTADVDILKVQFEVIKRRLQHLEEGGPSPTSVVPAYQPHQRTASAHRPVAPTLGHPIPSQARIPSEPRLLPSQPVQPTQYVQQPVSQPSHHHHAQQAAGGWVSVNTGTKRPLSSDHDAAGTPLGSPKRTKLAPMEARFNYPEQPARPIAPVHYQRMGTEESSGSQAYHAETHGSYPDATNANSFVAYTQDGGPDDSWRPDSQRAVSGPSMTATSPRGKGRGRGRPGRPRKSMPLEPHIIATPEWEKEGWTGSQIEADGFYRGGLAKRGSGGGPMMAMSPIQSMEPYGHTKRSRTKPIRNSDGVLIRKDGRPDMRSQSSAANLRKVHAKKEEDRLTQGAPDPASLPDDTATSVAESPASHADSHEVEPSAQQEGEEPSNIQERADHIMKQMFPKGIEQERTRLHTAQQYFNPDQNTLGSQITESDKARDDSPQQDEQFEKERPKEVSPQQDTEGMKERAVEVPMPVEPSAPLVENVPAPTDTTEAVLTEATASTATAQAS